MNNEKIDNCYICNSAGNLLYSEQQDKLFGVQGKWNNYKCSNPSCDLLWLSPRPIESDIWMAYTSYYTHSPQITKKVGVIKSAYRKMRDRYYLVKYGYDTLNRKVMWFDPLLSLPLYFFPPGRADADFAVMHLPFKAGGRLLEVGCGSGYTLSLFKRLGWRVEGVEIDPKAADVARSNGLEIHTGDLYSKHYEDNQFDAIAMSHVIEHVHDPIGILRECHRILKPKGVISLATPNSMALGHLLYGRSWLPLDPPRHLNLFNPINFEIILKKAGYEIVKNKTIIRDANSCFIGTRAIHKFGFFKFGSSSSLLLKIWGRGMQILEWWAMKINKFRGEEIIMVARKVQ
jgi:SAM-dependent methyltransferase